MKTNKTLKIIAGLLIAVLIAVLAGSGMYLKGQYDRVTYFEHTTVNGYDASDKTPNQIMDEIVRDYSISTVTLNEDGQAVLTGKLADYGYTVNQDRLLKSLKEKQDMQKSSILVLIGSLMHGNSFTVPVPFTYSPDTLAAKVTAANLTQARRDNVDASLEFNEAELNYYIKPEEQGTLFDDADLQADMQKQIDGFVSGNNPNKDLEVEFPEEIYIQPAIDQSDEQLNAQMNIYNSYVKAKVNYQFGSETQVLDWSTIKDWVQIEGTTGTLSEEKIRSYVNDLAANYNTRHYDRPFHTSLGKDIVIPSTENDYGYLVNEDAEYAQLLADIQSNTEVSREPIYYQTSSDYGNPLYYKRNGKDDLAGTYVEVNLSAQHLWFYKDGSLVVESDLVSGSVAKKSETKTGAFPLAYKESPSVLEGQDAANGYRTEVQYWMPFYDGQGLHDASWRSSFGGNIYQSNGSHGCVNLPPAVAAAIYDQIEAGVAIIIYK